MLLQFRGTVKLKMLWCGWVVAHNYINVTMAMTMIMMLSSLMINGPSPASASACDLGYWQKCSTCWVGKEKEILKSILTTFTRIKYIKYSHVRPLKIKVFTL